MCINIVDLPLSYLITPSGEKYSNRSLSQSIDMHASSFSFPRVEHKQVLTCFNLLKALSQLTWVNASVRGYSLAKQRMENDDAFKKVFPAQY